MGWESGEEWDESFPPLAFFALFPSFFMAASQTRRGRRPYAGWSCQGCEAVCAEDLSDRKNLPRHSHSSHYSHRFSWQLHKLGEVVVLTRVGLAKVVRQCAPKIYLRQSSLFGRRQTKSADGFPFALELMRQDYLASVAATSFPATSLSRSSIAAFRESRTLPFSSTPRHLTVMSSPTLTMSSVFLTRKLASSLM